MSVSSEVERAERRLRRLEFVRKIRINDLVDATTIDFMLSAPPEADTPRPERGPSALRSVLVFTMGEFNRVVLRYPSIEIDRFGKHKIDRLFDRLIESLRPPPDSTWFNSQGEDTVVPHFKHPPTEDGNPDWTLDEALDFIATSIERFNETFYGEGLAEALGVPKFRDNIRRRMEDGIGIEDVPRLDELERNVDAVLSECTASRELPDFVFEVVDNPVLERLDEVLEVERVLVFGSFAHGTALRGESDLDLLMTVNLTEDSTFARSHVEDCLQRNHAEMIAGFESWFSGIDVIVVDDEDAGQAVMETFADPFSDLEKGPVPTRGYNLRTREHEPI